MIKRAAKKILEVAGFELQRINNKFEPKKEDTFKWIRNLTIRTVFDVGANTEQFAGEIHAILPEAAIYSFEPLRECYDLLVEKMSYVPKFRAFDFALGDEASDVPATISGASLGLPFKQGDTPLKPSQTVLKLGR